RPADVSLLNRIARLEQPAPAAPVERTVRAFFGRFANRRPPGVRIETDIPVVAMPAEPEPSAPEPSSGDEPHPLGEAVEAQAPAQVSEPEVQVPSETERPTPGRDEPSIAHFAPAESSAESSAPESVAAPEPAAVAAPHEPEPLHERELASDRILSFAELFAGRATSAADEQAAATLAGVFGGGAHEHESAAVTFDEFFASRDAGAEPDVSTAGAVESHPMPAPSSRRADDADLELFHQWLEGLKK